MNYLEELNKWYDTIHADNDWASIPIITTIEENLGLTFDATSYDSDQVSSGNVCMAGSPEVRDEFKEIFTPIHLLAYIYAVLHSSFYRENHERILNVDFSQVPYPKDAKGFWNLVDMGGQLRECPQSQVHRLVQAINLIAIE